METALPNACFNAAANDKPAGPAPATIMSKTRGADAFTREGEDGVMASLSARGRRRASARRLTRRLTRRAPPGN